jgi:hypothetical protein
VLRALVHRLEAEFPKFLTGAEYEAMRPKRDEEEERRDDGDRRRAPRDDEVPDDLG